MVIKIIFIMAAQDENDPYFHICCRLDRYGYSCAAREKIYGPFMGDLSAHQASTFIGMILFGLYIWLLTGIFQIESSNQALLLGGIWLLITILFEFGFGHYVMGDPWERLFHDYNLFKGQIRVLVLIWISVAPYIAPNNPLNYGIKKGAMLLMLDLFIDI